MWYHLDLLFNVFWKPSFSSYLLCYVVVLSKDSLVIKLLLAGCCRSRKWDRGHCDLGPAISSNVSGLCSLWDLSKKLQDLQDRHVKSQKKIFLGCEILAHLLIFSRNGEEQVLERESKGKLKGEKVTSQYWFKKQALGSNLGQRFKSVLYLNLLT